MAKRNKRIYTILGAAVGAGLAAYGIRQGMRWYQRRQMTDRFDMQLPGSSWPVEQGYQPIEQPDREPIPATGPLPSAAPPLTDMTMAERVNSDMVDDFDERGTAFATTEMTSTRADELTGEDRPDTGSMTGRDTNDVSRTRDAQETGPTGGSVGAGRSGDTWTPAETRMGGRTGQDFNTDQHTSSQNVELVMDEFVAPLIEHAIAFNSVMNLLRSRQRDGEGKEGTESLTAGDRASMHTVLEQMQEHMVEYDEATMRRNPLALRSHNLTRKLRDALDNLEYSGTDLYRIHAEVRTELCSLARELDDSGQVTITGLDQVRQLYECQ